MKTRVICAALMLLCATGAFAADKKKIANPSSKQVILVGKVSVKADEDMDFIATTRGLTEQERLEGHTYKMPFVPGSTFTRAIIKESEKFEKQQTVYSDGEFFCLVYNLNKKRNISFEKMNYYFFNSEKSYIRLPLDFNFDVPEDVSAVYVGNLNFSVTGDDFVISSAGVTDDYEAAQEVLDSMTKKHFDLYRADLAENVYEEK